jgi:hypothetical protein
MYSVPRKHRVVSTELQTCIVDVGNSKPGHEAEGEALGGGSQLKMALKGPY